MNEEAGFFTTLAADPNDDVARLVYADWLDERADPRGEYLRLLVALPKMTKQREYLTLRVRHDHLQRQLDVRWRDAIGDALCRMITGRVTNVTRDFAEVDLGFYTGVFHVSDMSWTRRPDVRDLFQIGDIAEGYILHIDRSRRRIALGCYPRWSDIARRGERIADAYPVGCYYAADVEYVLPEGWHVGLESDIRGTIRRSDLPPTVIAETERIFVQGSRVEVTHYRD